MASGLFSGILIWLTRTWLSERIKNSIKHEYDQKLEVYKAVLKAEHDIAIERLRADLNILASKRQIQFSRLHKDAVDAITETYDSLQRLSNSVSNYISSLELPEDGTKAERRDKVNEALKSFYKYFNSKKIFLPKDLADMISSSKQKMYKIADRFSLFVEHGKTDRLKSHDEWVKSEDDFKNEVKPLLDKIEIEFRSLLGYDVD